MNSVICFKTVICLDSFMWAYVPANRIRVLCMTLNWSELLLHLGRNFQQILFVFPFPPNLYIHTHTHTHIHTRTRLGERTGLVVRKKFCIEVKYLQDKNLNIHTFTRTNNNTTNNTNVY
jgi:hypothetical protein